MAGETTIAKLLVRIGADAGSFSKGLKEAEKTLDKASKNLTSIGRSMSIGLTAPLLAASGAALKFAMDAVESENLFEVSMGGMAAAARKWSDDLSDSLGLNAYELRRSVGEWNVLLVNMKLNEDQAYSMSKSLVELSADMASFYNFTGGAAEAGEKLRSIMAGESEVARRLGIDISAAAVKTAAYAQGIAAQGAELTEAEKLLARYAIVMKQTSLAQGDLARTLDSPTNQLRILQEQVKQTAIQFGQALIPFVQASLPLMRDLSDYVRGAAEAFAAMDEDTKKWAVTGAGALLAVGPLSYAFGGLTGAMASVIRQGGALVKSSIVTTKSLKDERLAAIVADVAHMKLGTTKGNLVNLTRKYNVEVVNTSSAQRQLANTTRMSAGAMVQASAAVVGLGVLVYQLTRNVLELTGLDKELTEFFGLAADSEQEWVDQLTSNKDVYLQQLDLYNQLREKLGLTGTEWRITADNTLANVKALNELMPKAQAMHRQLIDQHAAQVRANEGTVDAIALGQRMREMIAAQDRATRDVIDRTREYYGVLTQSEVSDQVGQLLADFRLLKAEGISTEQITKAMKDRFAELGDVADDYIGLNLPYQFTAFVDAAKQGNQAFQDQVTLLGTDMPKAGDLAADALKGTLASSIVEAKETVKTQAKEMETILRALADGEYTIDVIARLDTEQLQRDMRDANLKPPTGGGVPWGP